MNTFFLPHISPESTSRPAEAHTHRAPGAVRGLGLRTLAIGVILLIALAMRPPEASAAVVDDFESYAPNSNVLGQGGWTGWAGNPDAGALVSSEFSFSPTRSVRIAGASDLVHTLSDATHGRWVFSVMQYVPSTSTGTNFVLLLNTYRPPYDQNSLSWSVALLANMDLGLISTDLGGGQTLPLLRDQWVPIRCEIDLDANLVSEFYNGQLLSTHSWHGGAGLPGQGAIEAIDLYASNSGAVYYDTLSLTPQDLVITVDIGRRSQGCTGFGICRITIDPLASARSVPTAAAWADGRLQLDFLADPADKSDILTIDEDIVLEPAIARALGYEQLTVKAGQYPVDYSVNPHGQVSPDVSVRGIIITIDIGRPSKNCTGFGICSITIEIPLSLRAVPTAANWVNGRLQLDFLSDPADKSDILTIDEDLVLDPATARALGYEQLTVKAGQYPVDYSVNPHGQVSPDVSARGIIITIDIGRPSKNCTGFGICSITVEIPLSLRAVPTAASWVNGRLQLDFLADPADKSDILTIDEDLVLDPATARALGYEQLTVKAGQYPVDYSVNPHGQVSPDVSVRGIIITIDIGRPSKNCTGFGICSITVEIPLSLRAVPTAASWVNGRLQLDFLADPADKSDILTIEKDIVLDPATARALGYEQLTVKAGQYHVDYTVNPHGQVSPDVSARGIIITIDIGRPSKNCTGFGICSITIEIPLSLRAVPTAASWVNGRLQLDFLADPADKSDILTIDEDIVLDPATARALGYEQLTVKAGQYHVDYSVNPHGQVSPDVSARGIIITIDIGRRSKDCRGFGICSITIEIPLSLRAVPTAASWVNGRLQLDFLSDPADKSDILTIDEDIVLDPATARALGYEQLTVKAGQYHVDYTVNPRGQVSPDVSARGIIITVDIGRPSKNCTGFGICSITVEIPLSLRAVPTAASWVNGRLQLDFLADPVDKSDVLTVEQDIVLDPATARALGYQQLTVKAGQYPVDYSVNPHGQVSPDVSARGIIITVDIGQRNRGCTGFGICSITIELRLTSRAVPTAASWVNGRLQLDFLADPADKSDILTIDEDIVLDPATARALGYEQLTVKAGQYPVDYSVNPHGQVSPDVSARGIIITIDIGRPSQRCTGFGICSITIEIPLSARAVPTAASWVNGRLQLDFLADPADKSDILTIDEDIVLDPATARALGYEHLTVKAGQYHVDYSVNPHGQVSPDVSARGIIITIDIGRPSKNCTGFGICSITVEIPLSLRAVPTAASWVNGRLQLDFLADPVDKSDVLTVEQDIVLDPATARALGYQQLTVKAGQYPVDYSVNPHGQVSPDVSARGIIITIHVGLRSKGCTGFGICGITIEFPLTAREVPTSATWVNGRLQLDFLADPADRSDILTIDEDIVLDPATARALGYEHLTVKAGQYHVDYSVNPHGQVSPDVSARGIIITVDIGRANQRCSGFGICRITLEIPLSLRAVPTAASWVNGRLQLDFLADPADKSDVLTIDQDIVLDPATARALGYDQLIVRAGQYPVDYSVNPHGGLAPDTATSLLGISLNAAGGLTIEWPNNGWTLEEATDVVGPWTPAPSQTSPLSVLPNGALKFYRLTFH